MTVNGIIHSGAAAKIGGAVRIEKMIGSATSGDAA